MFSIGVLLGELPGNQKHNISFRRDRFQHVSHSIPDILGVYFQVDRESAFWNAYPADSRELQYLGGYFSFQSPRIRRSLGRGQLSQI